MEYRPLTLNDLNAVKRLYQRVIVDLNDNDISIWDSIYPFRCFEKDINHKTMVALFRDSTIIACANVTSSHQIEDLIDWNHPLNKALYIERFAVSMDFRGCGMGKLMLKHIESFALKNNYDSIRLSVVDFNTPAIKFYESYGFKRIRGRHSTFIDDDSSFTEIAFELKICNHR